MRRHRTSILLASLIVFQGLSWVMGAPLVERTFATHIDTGRDLYMTIPIVAEPTFHIPMPFDPQPEPPTIPPNFFDPGSEPFSGFICLQGVPINPLNLGTTDTIVQRNAEAVLPGVGDADTVPIELVALSLQSCAPITVMYSGGGTELWDVQVTLSPSQPSQGQMGIRHSEPNGGTFDSVLNVQPKFIFTRVGDGAVRVLDTGSPLTPFPPYQFFSTGVPWVHAQDCPIEILSLQLVSDFCPSATQAGRVQTTASDGTSTLVYQPAVGICGNGTLEQPEQCDDGGNVSRDGCSDICVIELCGDGVLEPNLGEECDDGNDVQNDGCTNSCTLPRCGDGIVQEGEDCDDGNSEQNDTCPSTCQLDPVGPTCNGLPATIVGTPGDDHLVGTPGDDVIVGLEGNDKLEGRNGNDVLCGNEGDDELDGGRGADVLLGDEGDDELKGDKGEDQLFGGMGEDVLEGDRGDDLACGGGEDDTLEGEKGDDRMDGGAGDDELDGGKGRDTCIGESTEKCEDTVTPVPECS